jgi:UDP-2-acetamido-2-deoxy-ribo-hexuluronate aminotransferase
VIKITSLSRQYKEIKHILSPRLDAVYQQDQHMEGKWMLACEERLEQMTGRKHAHMVTSGTAALIIMHMSLGIGPGDTVLATNYSIPSSIMPARILGAKLKFIDINKYGQQDFRDMDISQAKAILTTGLYGDTHDHDALQGIGIPVINDSCQAFLAKYKGVEATKIGDASSISFAQNKTAPVFGTYGAILTDRDDISDSVLRMRRCGNLGRDADITHLGINAQPHADKCVQVLTALDFVDGWQQRRQEISDQYTDMLKDTGVAIRQSPDYSTTNNHKFVIFVDDNRQFAKMLAEKGVEAHLHYTYNFAKNSVIQQITDVDFPMTDFFCRHAVTIPSNPWLTSHERTTVIEAVKDCITGKDLAVAP